MEERAMYMGNDDELMGLANEDYDSAVGIQSPKTKAYGVRYGWGESLTALFGQFVLDPRIGEVRALVIGMWEHEGGDDVPGRLIEHAAKLSGLEALFVGDISCDENEVSWIEQFDLGAVVGAFPKLKHFKARGGMGLRLSELSSASLETLILETGGMDGATVRDVCAATLPELRKVELWTGNSEYGANVTMEDVMPLLVGTAYPEMRYPFPKLKHLGIVNSELADQIAEALRGAKVLDVIESLDLSKGLLSNEGAKALVENERIAQLKRLDISTSYVGDEELIERLQASGIEVIADGQKDIEEDYWYVELGE
jgi:hypothetical protein